MIMISVWLAIGIATYVLFVLSDDYEGSAGPVVDLLFFALVVFGTPFILIGWAVLESFAYIFRKIGKSK